MTCSKRKFRDQIAAKLALSRIKTTGEAREKTPRRAYRCPNCRAWHLTSIGRP